VAARVRRPAGFRRDSLTSVNVPRRCCRPGCPHYAVATLTFVYSDSTAVVGPLATASEPHSWDLCVLHAGRITAPGKLEGGDLIWLDEKALAIGRGYRTNAEGVRQLRALVGASVEVIEVPLPHWHGQSDVMHLMSLISPIDRDLAVVYSRLLPVPFREWLLTRDVSLVEVPDEEFESMGTNVLALGPRHCLMVRGNPVTKAALERAGAAVVEYSGREISVKGAGGPTCLTRPITRT